ncbi:alpha/beta fold hydrolase [Rhodococcus sp. IEGM 1351]|uniref:alpha/beta fold hydrolase n=1 Tax=Rhodococcus sp. IEGM 1351 TaxID=3047089 RepID=UPI0024B7CDA1|nr:alpha/beta fold hydrolase [Rhodococcus sp. IEGM 1351]MDI9939258.1 alpha/beta fold hydrolase [Rhodococcus sp. IEGM 1351]
MQFWNTRNRPSIFGRSAHASTVALSTVLLLVAASAPSEALPTLRDPAGDDDRPTGLWFGPCAEIAGTDDLESEGLECGTLDVPLSVDDPGAGTVHLAVSRLRATNPNIRRGVLVVNPGGPGGTGLEYAATKGAKLPEQVRAAYDIIGFDPRGIGHSVVTQPHTGEVPSSLNCGPMGGLFCRPVPPTDDLAALPGLAATARDCAAAVGPHAADYATYRVADDIDAIRRALGEQRISMLGVSYGTVIADRYARRYGDHVDRFILDSVVGPGPDGRDDWHAFDLRQAEALLSQRETMIGWWAQHPERIGLGHDPAAVRRSYDTVRALNPSGGIGADEFDRAVYRALGRAERWQPLGQAIAQALRTGDLRALEPVVPEVDDERRNSEAANRTVVCADATHPTFADRDPRRPRPTPGSGPATDHHRTRSRSVRILADRPSLRTASHAPIRGGRAPSPGRRNP